MYKKTIALLTSLFVITGAYLPVYAENEESPRDFLTEQTGYQEDTDISEDSASDETDSYLNDNTDIGTEEAADLNEDEAEYDITADWYEWDASTGTLTLKNQLPDTTLRKSLADIAGIDKSNIKIVEIQAGTKAGSITTGMFRGFSVMTEIRGLSNLDTSAVTNMFSMFSNCEKLTDLDLSNFDTSNVTNMASMFYSCKKLTDLDLSNFDTSNVISMFGMFSFCRELTNLDLSNFDTSNVTNMGDMFWSCYALTDIDLTSFDTSNVTNMACMFYACYALTYIDTTNFDTSNVTDMRSMFYCGRFSSLDLSGFDTSNVIDMCTMFYGCRNLDSLDLSSFDTSKVVSMNNMFSYCRSLTSLDLSSFDTSNVYDMKQMFAGCESLPSLDLSSFDTSNVQEMGDMFSGAKELKTILVSDRWSTDKLHDNHTGIFGDNTNLVGGAGTVFDSNKTDKSYAHIDGGASNPGYLTKAATAPEKPTVAITAAFGGRTVQLNCTDTDAEIYYNFGSSNITTSCDHVKAGETIFLNEPMTGNNAAMYFKAYKNGKWSELGKWGVLNVQIAKPLIVQSGKKSDNNFKVYTQTKDSYIVYTLDGSTPEINEGTNRPAVKNGRLVWSTSAVINVPKGKTVKAIAVRCGLVTSDVMTYTNS